MVQQAPWSCDLCQTVPVSSTWYHRWEDEVDYYCGDSKQELDVALTESASNSCIMSTGLQKWRFSINKCLDYYCGCSSNLLEWWGWLLHQGNSGFLVLSSKGVMSFLIHSTHACNLEMHALYYCIMRTMKYKDSNCQHHTWSSTIQ
jgi:hypothetical protein